MAPRIPSSVFWSGHNVTGGDSLFSLYGWTTNPLVEYRIVEDYGASQPFLKLPLKGTVTSDGSLYNIYEAARTNEPSIQGIANFTQYWSVRQSPRGSGYLTPLNHFDAWTALGMPLGTFDYQILAVESRSGSGSVNVKIANCVPEYGQCGGQTFTGATCAAGLTCMVNYAYFSNCYK
ncbi:concanavalin A-like lectin/glucanase domain-containing protein [Mycena polygramma]|nr:concanavalin A-like lectin/glucanase domain-containing protein [Mycena polygramma]